MSKSKIDKTRHNAALKAWETRRKRPKVLTSTEVVDELINANTPGLKAVATRHLNEYVAQRATDGKNPTMVRAAIKASVTKQCN